MTQNEGETAAAPQIRQTNNMALAITLFTASVPIPCDEKGRPIPCSHFYDKPTLRKLGYEGWGLEKAAQDAIEKGRSGIVVYNFLHCEKFDEIVKAWDKQAALIKDADQAACGVGVEASGDLTVYCTCGKFLPIPESVVARICCQFAKNRKVYASLWQKVKAMVVHAGTSTFNPRQDKLGGTMTGSFKAVPVGASAETKRRVGL